MSLENEINEKTKNIILEKEELLEKIQEQTIMNQQIKREYVDMKNEYQKINSLF